VTGPGFPKQLDSVSRVRACRQGSTYVHIETFFHTGIHNCSGVTYAMVIRHPMERLYSHLTFEHIAATEVKALLLGQTSSSNASYPHNVRRERRSRPCLRPE
jgi:hypothetical protein